MLSFLVFAALASTTAAQKYGYAIDINQLGSSSAFSCVRSSGYATTFIRAYVSNGTGAVDTNAVPNVNLAYQAGLGIEVYMTPNPSSSKKADKQVDEVLNALQNGGVSVRSLWIQATSPVNWPSNQKNNLAFINLAIQRTRARGVRAGIYTNSYDWQQITNNAGGLGTDVMLWYWNVYGSGVGGETPATFADFRAFGNWNAANVKQFGQFEPVCGFTANRDSYPVSSVSAEVEKTDLIRANRVTGDDKLIVAGTIGL